MSEEKMKREIMRVITNKVEGQARTKGASLREDADGERLQELNISNDTIAAAVQTLTAAARSNRELVQQDGILALQNLSICAPL